MKKDLLYAEVSSNKKSQIHFIASKNFSNINFFRNVTEVDSNYDFSNLQVYINSKLTEQTANSISANTNDVIIIRAMDDHYPWFGRYDGVNYDYDYDIDYIKSIEEPFPLMHQANGEPITNFINCFYRCTSLTNISAGLFDNNPQVTSFEYCFCRCTSLTSIPEGLFNNNTQVTSFDSCFYGCTGLINIPQGLFDKNTLVTRFVTCFYGCTSLTVNVQIGSIASSVSVSFFARNTKEKGTVYCRAGSAAYTAFSNSTANVNVLTY